MRIRSVVAAVGLVPLLALTIATEHTPTFSPASLYGSCDNAVGHSQDSRAGKVIAPVDGIALVVTTPTASFQEGAGCGQVDEPGFGATGVGASPYEYYLSGYAANAGNVRSLTVELHFLGPNTGYAGETAYIDLQAKVDGVSLFGQDTFVGVVPDNPAVPVAPVVDAAERRIPLTFEMSSTGLSAKAVFTITGLDTLDPSVFAGEDGDGTRNRFVELMFSQPHTGECPVVTPNGTERCVPFGASPLVLGATEVPTGVTFNLDADPEADLGHQEPSGQAEEEPAS